VCHIIDELLNLELYRREFQFLQPVFPPDEEDEGEDESTGETDVGDQVFHINGIEMREISLDQNGGTTVKKKNISNNVILEETKINFFNPN
jgi:hypothetical protein